MTRTRGFLLPSLIAYAAACSNVGSAVDPNASGGGQSHAGRSSHAGNGSGNRALQHTIATGLDYVVTPHLFSSTRFSYQHTFAIRENGVGVPTLGMLGVKSFMYTTGDIPGQDMLKAGIFNSGNTGTFYVNTPQLSQDFNWTKGNHTFSFGSSWTRPSGRARRE